MESLTRELARRLKRVKRVAVLGVGSELRADDAAGVFVADAIKKSRAKFRKGLTLKAFSGSTAPENITGEIREFRPGHIIIVDTAEFGEKPGTVLFVNAGDLGRDVSFSTHKIPTKILTDYFSHYLKCGISVIGIQPKSIDFNKPFSRTVKDASRNVVYAILAALK